VIDDQVAFQRSFYDQHFAKRSAAVKDQLAHPLLRSFNDRIAAHIFDRGGEPCTQGLRGPNAVVVRVLEVGCGDGLLAASLRSVAEGRGIELAYTGLDLSEASMDLARPHVQGDLLAGDATELLTAMADGSHDIVVAKNLLHHLDDPAGFLGQAGRVVGPAGRVVVFEPNLTCPSFLLFNVLAPRRERHYFRGRGRNIRAFTDAGLRVERMEQFGWLPYELAFVIRYPVFRRLFSTDRPTTIERAARADQRLTRSVPFLASYCVWSAAPS
jgi:2-polyprenyl-3-methyl-5-hydroxy-6-metoxy-1,4-benzoquinol methylase